MATMSNYLENKLIDHTLRGIPYTAPTTTYAALLTVSPDDTNTITEVTGGSYTRVAITSDTTNWSGTQGAGTTLASSGITGTTTNNTVITFPAPTANWGLIVGVALMDAATGGNVLLQGNLAESITVNSGGPAPSFPVSTFSFQIDN